VEWVHEAPWDLRKSTSCGSRCPSRSGSTPNAAGTPNGER